MQENFVVPVPCGHDEIVALPQDKEVLIGVGQVNGNAAPCRRAAPAPVDDRAAPSVWNAVCSTAVLVTRTTQ